MYTAGMNIVQRPLRLAYAALLLLAACDHARRGTDPGYDEDAEVIDDDAGGRDSGVRADADVEDEGGVDEDAGIVSGDEHCTGEVFTFDGVRSSGRRLSLLVVGDVAHLVYPTPSCSGTSAKSTAQSLSHVELGATGRPSDPRVVANESNCSVTRDPALYTDGEDLRVLYTTNAMGPYDLASVSLTEGPADAKVTDAVGTEVDTAVVTLSGTPRAFFSREPVGASELAAPILNLAGSLVSDTLTQDANVRATELVASQLLDGSSLGAIAFPSAMSAAPGLYLTVVDAEGAARGAPALLSSALGAGSAAALASNDDGGAVIYSEVPGGEAHQLRFRAIASDGSLGAAVKLTTANQDLRDLALAAFKGGYLAAYRRTSAIEGLSASMRLLFVDEVGNVKMTAYVADAGSTQGTTQLGVAENGDTFFVAWSNVETITDDQTTQTSVVENVSIARFSCKTVPKLTCDD